MYLQMVVFISLTVFFSPIITLEARTLFEVPTTVKGPVIKNTFPFYFQEELAKDVIEETEQKIEDFEHKYWMKKRTPTKFHFISETEQFLKENVKEAVKSRRKSVENKLRNDSMKQFVTICSRSLANLKLDNLIACALEGFKEA